MAHTEERANICMNIVQLLLNAWLLAETRELPFFSLSRFIWLVVKIQT